MDAILETAEGPVGLAWTGRGFRALAFLDGAKATGLSAAAPKWVHQGAARILAFLEGQGAPPEHLPVDLEGLSPFRREVAELLRTTSPGDRLSYGEIAFRLGRPGAARAVGQAVKANALLLLIPCHRVVSATGEGGWSAFGSLERLRRLRDLDRLPGDTGR
ncbi:MAG TPA: methylated-DNA--[protein]-cysteine S-methyltransferase [Holophagaceae bacterium]|nr:methylated-DNA--[protein]-cysteine S-methyltransferase [Holophagaceae bacterium]